MPNGDDKNWVRICSAVDGFRGRHGRWPTGVRLPPAYFENVVGHVLNPVGFAVVSGVFAIISDDELSERVAIIAVDESGAEFRYGDEDGVGQPQPTMFEYFGSSVLRKGLGCGLEYVKVVDASGNVLWAGEGVQPGSTDQSQSAAGSVQLSDFLSQVPDTHEAKINPAVACNALYKTANNFNCYLTPQQAIDLALHLVQRVQLIRDESLADTAVQLWNQGAANEKLYLGLIKARKGPRKKAKKPPTSGSRDKKS